MMLPILIADVGLGALGRDPRVPIFLVVGGFVLVTISEAAILNWFRKQPFYRSLLDALAMNLVSTFLGVLFALSIFALPSIAPLLFPARGWEPLFFVLWTYSLSVISEFLVLLLFRWPYSRKTLFVVMVANAVSYLTVVVWIMFGFAIAPR